LQIYLSPEMIKNDYQLLNIVDQNNKPVGFLSFLFAEKRLYVFGQAEIGVKEDFKDLVKPYIQGMKKSIPEVDIFCYLISGGEKIDLYTEEKEEP